MSINEEAENMTCDRTIRQSVSIQFSNKNVCVNFFRYLRSLVPVGFREEAVTLATIALPVVSVFLSVWVGSGLFYLRFRWTFRIFVWTY